MIMFNNFFNFFTLIVKRLKAFGEGAIEIVINLLFIIRTYSFAAMKSQAAKVMFVFVG